MNKRAKSLIVLFLAFLIGSCFNIDFTQAQDDELNLKTTNECNIQYSGDSCVAELELTNNTGEILDGKAIFSVEYNNQPFDGIGIYPFFSIDNSNWINFTDWQNSNTTTTEVFAIPQGENPAQLKIKTHPALYPGQYDFTLSLKGTAETGEEYITPPVVLVAMGGGGGYFYTPPTVPTTETGEVTATPHQGGRTTLINPDGSKLELDIPSSAIPQATAFSIKQIDINSINQPDANTGLFLIAGCIYEISAQQADGSLITEFSKSLTLTFTYTDEQIKDFNEDSLEIYWQDNDKDQWASLDSQLDKENNMVIALTDHFSAFALIGNKIKPFYEKIKEGVEEFIEGIIEEIEEIIPGRVEAISEGEEIVIPEAEGSVPLEEGIGTENIEAERPATTEQVAAIAMIWSGITQSAFLTILVILLLSILMLMGIRKWRLFRKKKKPIL